MAKNRKAFIDSVVKDLDAIYVGGGFGKIMRGILEGMSQKQFDLYIERLRNGVSRTPDLDKPRELLTLVIPNMAKTKLSIENNLALAKKWGLPLFERIWITDQTTGEEYLTNQPYLVVDLPVSRQAQTLDEKISVAADNKHVDDRTDQATGASKGASFSQPETQIMLANGLEKTTTELLKFRGGDEVAFRTMNKELIETGEFSQSMFDNVDTRAKASTTLSVYFKAMHLDNNL